MTGVYTFDHDHGAAARDLAGLLGGKGAGLAEMTAALGLSVPPGFTISVPVCRAYRESGWPAGLDEALAGPMTRLGARGGGGTPCPRAGGGGAGLPPPRATGRGGRGAGGRPPPCPGCSTRCSTSG